MEIFKEINNNRECYISISQRHINKIESATYRYLDSCEGVKPKISCFFVANVLSSSGFI